MLLIDLIHGSGSISNINREAYGYLRMAVRLCSFFCLRRRVSLALRIVLAFYCLLLVDFEKEESRSSQSFNRECLENIQAYNLLMDLSFSLLQETL